jgi:vancomycin permeability regulator SanA
LIVPVQTEQQPEVNGDGSDVAPAGVENKQVTDAGRRRKLVVVSVVVLAVLVVLGFAPTVWVYWTSTGHRDPQPAPDAPVGIVFGAQLRDDQTPKPYLQSRLDAAAALYKAGHVRALLVSGDEHGTSGNEVAAMTKYLVAHGVPAARVVQDGYGLDTYDTCARAHQVYGVRKALLFSQDFHVPRAVTLCRHLGIDADGIEAPTDGTVKIRVRNWVREVAADAKAVVDVARHRPPAVRSAPSGALARAEAG